MKSIITTILFIIIAIGHSFGQDIITKRNGDEIEAKVLEVNSADIKFKRFDNINGPIYSLSKLEVSMILYENGSKDIFDEQQTVKSLQSIQPTQIPAYLSRDMEIQGMKDARINYHGQNSGAMGTAVAAVAFPLLALAPAIICTSVKPKDANLKYRDPELMKDPMYRMAYTNEAHKIKKKKVWTHYGVGVGIRLVISIGLAVATLNAL